MANSTVTLDTELRVALKKLRLGKMIPTLPERLLLARQNNLSHEDLLLLLLRDEIDRRDSTATARRAHTAGLDPDMVLERTRPPRSTSTDVCSTSSCASASSRARATW